MLESLYIFYSIAAFFFLSIGYYFYNKRFESVLFFAVSVILFGVLIFSSLTIESVIAIYDPVSETVVSYSAAHINYGLLGINLLFLAVSILFFYLDFIGKLPKIINKNVE